MWDVMYIPQLELKLTLGEISFRHVSTLSPTGISFPDCGVWKEKQSSQIHYSTLL